MSDSDDDYDVGYRKPPLATRFGQPNGNRRGRGRKSRNLKTDLQAELAESVPVMSNGKQLVLSQQRAMLKSLVVNAIKGNTQAASKVLDLVARVIGVDEGDLVDERVTAEDQAILEAYRARSIESDND